MSDSRTADKEQESRNKRKNVMISSKSRVIKSHSDTIKKTRTNSSHEKSIRN